MQLGCTVATHAAGARHDLASEVANDNMKPLTDEYPVSLHPEEGAYPFSGSVCP